MKILRDGPNGEAWKLSIECPGCKSLIEVEQTDLRPLTRDESFTMAFRGKGEISNGFFVQFGFTCPKSKCENIVLIPQEQLPPELQEKTYADFQPPMDWEKGFDLSKFFEPRLKF